MYRVCLLRATGKLIAMQEGGKVDRSPREEFKDEEEYQKHLADCDAIEANRLDTIKQNALRSGFAEDEIEAKWMTAEEWAAIEAANRDPNVPIKAKLTEIDLKSIRSLRDWVAAQPDAPQFIKDYEAAAVAERAKLK
ncbi:MAG TPA: hypothetical protein PLB96_03910 [Syntrophales bacterium]|nr:hypothetical protein [Syntrophales bacterium]